MQHNKCLVIAPTNQERDTLQPIAAALKLDTVPATYYLHNATGPRSVNDAMLPNDGSYPETLEESLPGKFMGSGANAVLLSYETGAYHVIGSIPVLLSDIKRAYEASYSYGGTHTGRLAVYVCGVKPLSQTIPSETRDKNTSSGRPTRHGLRSLPSPKRIDMQDPEVVSMARLLGILKNDTGQIQPTAQASLDDDADYDYDETAQVPLAPLAWLPDNRVVEFFSQCDVYDVQQAGNSHTVSRVTLQGAEFVISNTTTL